MNSPVFHISHHKLAKLSRKNRAVYMWFTIIPFLLGIGGCLKGEYVLITSFFVLQLFAVLPAYFINKTKIEKIRNQTCQVEGDFLSIFINGKMVVKVPIASINLAGGQNRNSPYLGLFSSLDWYEDWRSLEQIIIEKQCASRKQ